MWSLFFPRQCLGCERPLVAGERHICLHCLEGLPRPEEDSLTDNEVARKLWGRLPLNGAIALWQFNTGSEVQQIIHRLKYDERPAACRYMGAVLARRCVELSYSMPPWDAVAYVPMHPAKLRERGYNQAELMAEGLAAQLRLPLVHAVRKHQETGSQTRLGRAARWRNVQAAFSSTKTATEVNGLRILLVDDVLTTGATVEGAAQPLLQAGASQIGIAVLANAV